MKINTFNRKFTYWISKTRKEKARSYIKLKNLVSKEGEKKEGAIMRVLKNYILESQNISGNLFWKAWRVSKYIFAFCDEFNFK